MESIPVREVIARALCNVGCEDDRTWGDLDSSLAHLTKVFFEVVAESEVERRTGARLHERAGSRVDYRNGYRKRTVQLSYQVVEIKIPRLRGSGYVPSFLEPGHRAVRVVERYVQKAFLAGLSRSEVVRLMESATGCRPSDKLIGRVQKLIDEQVVAFKERPLTDRYQYLFLDAAWAKDLVGDNATRICILTAVGVTWDGRKEILGFERVRMESEAAWRGFLGRLVGRGLNPAGLAMVISDEHRGLLNAVSEVLGEVAHQLCWAHRCRRVWHAVNASDRKDVIPGLRDVYKAPHLTAAKAAFRRWRDRWQESYPGVVQTVQEDLGFLLAFYACPEQHREYVRTSNPIERVFRELRRQQYGTGAYANPEACNRAVFKVFSWLNDVWANTNIWQTKPARQKQLKAAA
jgi:putative transposase